MKPKVTIGICVKNSEATIKETIDSILAQDFPREQMELIVVDGCSTDSTLNIVRDKLKDSNLNVRIFCENKGLGYARQLVVDNADGKYILWVDGDTFICKDYVKKLVEFMDQNPRIGIAKGKYSLEITSNTLSMLEVFSRYAEKLVKYNSPKIYSKTFGTAGAIYRTQAIKNVGGFDKSLRYYCEDWDAEIRIRKSGWSLAQVDAKYADYERCGLTCKDLWVKYWLRGYHTHYFLHKYPGIVRHYRMIPPAAFLAGMISAHKMYKITKKKFVFLLPLLYIFKSAAWYTGFINSHIKSYEPKMRPFQLAHNSL